MVKSFAVLLTATLALVAGACTQAPQTLQPTPIAKPAVGVPVQPLNPPVKLKVGVIGLSPEVGLYLAVDKGYMREEGLEVELVTLRTGGEQVAALATRQIEFGAGGIDPSLFNAAERDIGVKIVGHHALATAADASAALIVRKELADSQRVMGAKDLKGLTIAVNAGGTTSQLYLERILALGGLTLGDINMTLVPFTDMPTALANGAIDAAWEVEPFVTLAATQGIAKALVPMGEAYPGAVTEVVMMSPAFGAEQPEAARRFVAAHLRGQRDYYRAFVSGETGDAGKDEIAQVVARYTAVKDPKLFLRIGKHGVDPNGAIDLTVLEDMQQYFLKLGVQNRRMDLGQVIDHRYLDYALERLGKQV